MKYPKIPLEKCLNRKLMPSQIEEIKKLYEPRVMSCAKLARKYGVDWHTIYYHVSDKEKERVRLLRNRNHEKNRTDPIAHQIKLGKRKIYQRRVFDLNYRPMRDYYNEKAVQLRNKHKI